MACRDLSQTVLQRSTSFLQAISSPKILISSDMKNCEKTTPVGLGLDYHHIHHLDYQQTRMSFPSKNQPSLCRVKQ